MPSVSAIILFHRLQPFFAQAVESMLAQTHRDLELLLIDNGCQAPEECIGAARHDPRLRWLRLPTHLGIARGYAAGIAATTGEYVAILDYDDLALPDRLEKQVAALRADPALGLVYSCAHRIDQQGRITGREFALCDSAAHTIYSRYTLPAPNPSCTGRRQVFEQFPFRPALEAACDYDLHARAVEHWQSRALPEVLLHYRQHPHQVSHLREWQQRADGALARLLTARRRAGRAEDSPGALAHLGSWATTAPPLPELYAHYARWSLAERFPYLAVYHARKLLSVQRSPRTLALALATLGAALRQSPREAAFLLRLFFTGPLRAHGLRPA